MIPYTLLGRLTQMTCQILNAPKSNNKETPEIVKATGKPDSKEINKNINILTNINS